MNMVVGAIGFFASYYLAARFGLEMATLREQAITVIWLPAGISVVALMVFGWWGAPLVWTASLAFGGGGLLNGGAQAFGMQSALSAFVDTAQGVLIWRLCRSDLPVGVVSVGDLARFGILACFVPIVLGGLELAFKLLLEDEMVWQHLLQTVVTGGVADALGLVATVPAYWAWHRRAPGVVHETAWIAFFVVLSGMVLYGAMRERSALVFFAIPVLVGLAMQTGLRGAVIGQALLFLGLIAATVQGAGAFAGVDEFRAYVHLLAYIIPLGFATMAVAVGYTRLSADRARLAASLESQNAALARETADRRQLQEQLMHRAHYDELTGLPNRATLYDRLQQAIVHARRRSARFAILFIDLDGFKPVNDTWGHEAGDLLLKQVGERLRNCVRESDTVARMGGDEFTIIVTDTSFRRSAVIVADKVIASLSEPFCWAGNEARISASVGISIYPDDGEQAELLLSRADAAMYSIKRLGKNSRGFYAAEVGSVCPEESG